VLPSSFSRGALFTTRKEKGREHVSAHDRGGGNKNTSEVWKRWADGSHDVAPTVAPS
jgi:hypothetical protein